MAQPEFNGDDRRKHLEFVQAVITRLSTNSFLLKGWSVTVAVAAYSFSAQRMSWPVALLGLLAAFAFWLLDGYFLWQERLFRRLYDAARQGRVDVYGMDKNAYSRRERRSGALFSMTLVLLYGANAVVGAVVLVAGLRHD